MKDYAKQIHGLGISIYDKLPDHGYFIPDLELEHILEQHFLGFKLENLPARTRSKLAKKEVCRALGYPVPESFKGTHPRFPGQDLDVYVQSSNNLQIWNEKLCPERRYALIRPDADGIVVRVRVVRGVDLAQFDTTGTFTSKFQARMTSKGGSSCLLSEQDAPTIAAISSEVPNLNGIEPVDLPSRTTLYSIDEIYRRLLPIVGTVHTIPSGYSDRIRGEVVHKEVCRQLGYESFADDGTFPDVKNQLLEVKAQTSPTIDLGLHNPSTNVTILETEQMMAYAHEVRYAIFDCETIGDTSFRVNALYVVTGGDFDSHFPLCKGMVQNRKIQLPLPGDFFDVRPKQA